MAKTIKAHKITRKCLAYVYTHVYFTKSRLPEQILKNLEKSTREYKLRFTYTWSQKQKTSFQLLNFHLSARAFFKAKTVQTQTNNNN